MSDSPLNDEMEVNLLSSIDFMSGRQYIYFESSPTYCTADMNFFYQINVNPPLKLVPDKSDVYSCSDYIYWYFSFKN